MRRIALGAVLLATSCISISDLVTAGGDDAGLEAGSDATSTSDGGADADAERSTHAFDSATSEGAALDSSGEAAPGCPGPYASAVMKLPALLGYWRLDETTGSVAHDMTGKHPGTYRGGVALGRPGLLVGDPDPAAAFDGEGGNVDVPEAEDLELQTFTLGALIDPSAITSAAMGQQIVAHTLDYWLQLDAPTNSADSPHLEVGFISPGPVDHPLAPASASLGIGEVAHVVGTYDGAAAVVYVDGDVAASFPLQATVSTMSTDLYIGSWDGTSHFQAGVIDEVFVLGTALTAGEVRSLYLSSRGCAYDEGDGG